MRLWPRGHGSRGHRRAVGGGAGGSQGSRKYAGWRPTALRSRKCRRMTCVPGIGLSSRATRDTWTGLGGIPPLRIPWSDVSLANLGLPLDAVAIRRLCGAELGGLVDTALGIANDDRDIDETERSEAVTSILATLRRRYRCRRDGTRRSGSGSLIVCAPTFSNRATKYHACLVEKP